MVGHHLYMFKRGCGDGKLEQQVDVWHESSELITQRHAKRAQAHDFPEVLAERWVSRALKTSGDLQVATFLHKLDKPSTHFPGCARNCDTHIYSPRQPSSDLVDCMVCVTECLPPPTAIAPSAFGRELVESPPHSGEDLIAGVEDVLCRANYNNPKSFRAISNLVRLFGSIGASGRRTSGLILPIIPRAVFTGVGLVSMNNVLCNGQSL